MGCQRPSRFWGLGCPKIYHEAEDTLAFLFRGGGLAGFDELAPCVIPATDAGQAVFPAHPVVAGITVGLECSPEAIEQAQGHGLTA